MRRFYRSFYYFFLFIILASGICSCGKLQDPDTLTAFDAPEVNIEETKLEVVSILGDSIFSGINDDIILEANLEQAKADLEQAPDSVELWIWYGRRAAYIGKYRDAISIYTQAIDSFPKEARLYRHRGHRYISTREFDKAIKDLELAAGLIEGSEDKIEPDGIANAAGIPISTLHGNIWYHLGLAYYLKGNFEKALEVYQNKIFSGGNDDNLVSGLHWKYMTLRRLGKGQEAELLLESISSEMEIMENFSYHKLCLFYKGEMEETDLLGVEGSANDAILYGLANWYFYNQSPDRARELLEEIIDSGNKMSFGYIAAEMDYFRQFSDNI